MFFIVKKYISNVNKKLFFWFFIFNYSQNNNITSEFYVCVVINHHEIWILDFQITEILTELWWNTLESGFWTSKSPNLWQNCDETLWNFVPVLRSMSNSYTTIHHPPSTHPPIHPKIVCFKRIIRPGIYLSHWPLQNSRLLMGNIGACWLMDLLFFKGGQILVHLGCFFCCCCSCGQTHLGCCFCCCCSCLL